MKLTTNSYFLELDQLTKNTIVTNADNAAINIDSGIDLVIDIISRQNSVGRKVMMIGNGGSAAIANHIVIDLWKNAGIKALSFSDSSHITCVSNDYGYDRVFEKSIEMFAEEGDVLIAISSSGKSQNILNGVKAALQKNCKVITMSGFDANNPLRMTGILNFYVPSTSYGYVEIMHMIFCHFFVDVLISNKLEREGIG